MLVFPSVSFRLVPLPSCLPPVPAPAYGRGMNSRDYIPFLIAQHHPSVVYTHGQVRVFLLEDADKVDEVTASCQGSFL